MVMLVGMVCSVMIKPSSSSLKNPRHSQCIVIQFFYHESGEVGMRGAFVDQYDTHASTSDPESRLYRKAAGREAKLCYMGHATRENRHGLAVAGRVTLANGTAERRASEIMLKAKAKEVGRRIT